MCAVFNVVSAGSKATDGVSASYLSPEQKSGKQGQERVDLGGSIPTPSPYTPRCPVIL